MDSFANKYLGGRIADNTLGSVGLPPSQWYQCVSLIKQGLREMYGINPGAWGDAIDYWLKPNPAILEKFSMVQGTAQKGDIIVFKAAKSNGNAGHIAWAMNGNTMLEQNGGSGGGTGTGSDAIRMRTIPYASVAGILRPKVIGGIDMADKIDVNLSRVISHGLLGRNGIVGRPYSLNGSAGDPWVGGDLTAAFLMDVFNSKEASDWRDSSQPTAVSGINQRLGEVDALKAQVKALTEQLAAVPATSGGLSAEQAAQLSETNSVVKWIKDLLSKVFK